MIFLI